MAEELRLGPDVGRPSSMAVVTFIRTDTPFTCKLYKNRGTVDYILITNLMLHQLLFIHKIIFSSTCFEPQVLIFRRI